MKENIRTILIILAIIGAVIVMRMGGSKPDTTDEQKAIKSALERIDKRTARDSIYRYKNDSLVSELNKRDGIIFAYQKQLKYVYDQLYQKIDDIMGLSDDQLIEFYAGQLSKKSGN